MKLSRTVEVHTEWDSTTAHSEFLPNQVQVCKVQIQMPFSTCNTENWCLHVAEQKHRHSLEQPDFLT